MKRNRLSRSGFTLRELTIAMAVGSTVMMAAVGIVHSAFDWSQTARHRRHDDQVFFNLARTLRHDITMATQSTVADDRLELQTDQGLKIVYQINDRSIDRTATVAESSDKKPVIGRERYRWKRARWVNFNAIDGDEAGEQIRMDIKTVTPFGPNDTPLWRSTRASMGLRLRHQTGDIQ